MSLLAIDPGTTESGYCVMNGRQVVWSGVKPNAELLQCCASHDGDIAIEMVAGMGMRVGRETFETVRWIGRFQQAAKDPEAVRLVYRKDVKMHLCGKMAANDTTIRRALIDMYGGDVAAIGKKKNPGPLHGVKSHAWSALAVGITAMEKSK